MSDASTIFALGKIHVCTYSPDIIFMLFFLSICMYVCMYVLGMQNNTQIRLEDPGSNQSVGNQVLKCLLLLRKLNVWL